MGEVFTESALKKLSRWRLIETARSIGVAVLKDTTNSQIINLILGCCNQIAEDCPGKYTKEFFLLSQWYSHRRVTLNTVLEDGQLYSFADVEKLVR